MIPNKRGFVARLIFQLGLISVCVCQMDNNISTNESVPCRYPIVSSSADKSNGNGSLLLCPSGYGLGNAIGGCREIPDSGTPSNSNNNFNATNNSNRPNGSTVCVLCQAGVSFRKGQGTGHCQLCTKCGEDAIEMSRCNGTHDAQCRCPKGMYYETYASNESTDFNLAVRCRRCDACPHGWGVSRQCTENRNTSCRKCPPGTYSGVLSGTRDCALCTVCRDDQLMLQECNRIQDTICIDKNSNKRHPFPSTAGDSKSVQTETENVSHRHETEDIPVYCTILIPVALGLFVYVLLRWRMRHANKSSQQGLRGDSSPAAFRQDILLLGGQSPVSQICPQKYTPQVKIHVNQLSSTKRRDLEAALNVNREDGKDWRGLAKHLGYHKISTFEENSNQSGRGAAGHLLSEWAKLETSTTEALALALMELGRIDIVWILQPTCQKMFPPSFGGEMV